MKTIFVSTTLNDNQRTFSIAVMINGKLSESHSATLGTVVNVRNSILDRLCNDPEVDTCEANAIPYPMAYKHRERSHGKTTAQ